MTKPAMKVNFKLKNINKRTINNRYPITITDLSL